MLHIKTELQLRGYQWDSFKVSHRTICSENSVMPCLEVFLKPCLEWCRKNALLTKIEWSVISVFALMPRRTPCVFNNLCGIPFVTDSQVVTKNADCGLFLVHGKNQQRSDCFFRTEKTHVGFVIHDKKITISFFLFTLPAQHILLTSYPT